MNQTTLDTYRRMHELLDGFPEQDERRIIAAAMGLENYGTVELRADRRPRLAVPLNFHTGER